MRAPRPSRRDLRIKWAKRRREAVLWLGSSACSEWLELIGLKTTRVLTVLAWHKYARKVLRDDLLVDEPMLEPAERELLLEGIRYMEHMAEKVA